MHISRTDRRPMYLQLIEQIKHRIAVGDWPPGAGIPSIRALAAATRVSVITVKRAFTDLEREGVLVTRPGKGTFVAEQLGSAGHEDELKAHMQAALSVATRMGLSEQEMEARWHALVEGARKNES